MFDNIHSAIRKALHGDTLETVAPTPDSPLRSAAAALHATVAAALANGDWNTGGAHDPQVEFNRIGAALEEGSPDHILARRTLDLVDVAVGAISEGAWMIGAPELDAVFDASTAAGAFATANDDPAPNAVAI